MYSRELNWLKIQGFTYFIAEHFLYINSVVKPTENAACFIVQEQCSEDTVYRFKVFCCLKQVYSSGIRVQKWVEYLTKVSR